MTELERHRALVDILNQEKAITLNGIMERFCVSAATARRDINKLEEQGKLRKVRNGAEATSRTRQLWTPMNIHQTCHLEEKVRIAQAAARLCDSGKSIVINCGSTALLLGQEICGKDIQVISNYLPLVNYLVEQEHENVVIIGGQYHREQSITLTPMNENQSAYAGYYMFTSCKGLTAEGVYKADLLTAMAEQRMLEQVDHLVLLVDSSKIGQRGGMLFCNATQIDTVITGREADETILKSLEDQGVTVIRA